MMPTTPLLPPYPTPLYYCIDALIEDLWEDSLVLEEKYYNNPSEDIMHAFAINVITIQYWETVSMKMQMEHRR